MGYQTSYTTIVFADGQQRTIDMGLVITSLEARYDKTLRGVYMTCGVSFMHGSPAQATEQPFSQSMSTAAEATTTEACGPSTSEFHRPRHRL